MFMENYNLAQVCGTACVINLRDFVYIIFCERMYGFN